MKGEKKDQNDGIQQIHSSVTMTFDETTRVRKGTELVDAFKQQKHTTENAMIDDLNMENGKTKVCKDEQSNR